MSQNRVLKTFFPLHRNANGHRLVLHVPGNNSAFEHGLATTPLELGFSLLSVDRLGYGLSSGFPYPSLETAAMVAVLQAAEEHLQFPPSLTTLYGWSMGGHDVGTMSELS